MRILKIVSQYRRDFSAVLVCEHCGNQQDLNGDYDDDNYHRNVIPSILCSSCGKAASEDYRLNATKYSANQVI